MSNPRRKNRYKAKKQLPTSVRFSEHLPTTRRSRGGVSTKWKDIKWTKKGAIIATSLLLAPYLGAVIVTFLLGMTIVTGLLIGVAIILGLIVALLRWIDKAEL